MLGAVFTVSEARGQRLATRLLENVLADARRGTDLVLASGDRDLYRRQGLEPTPPLARFRVTTPGAAAPSGLEVRALDPASADVDAVAALYDAEPVHFVRPLEDWRRLLAAGMLVDAPATFHTVCRAGRIVAYVAVQRESRRPDGTKRPRRALELAGDKAAIIEALPAIADEVLVAGYDAGTIVLAERQGWTRTTRQFLITAEALTANVVVIPWYGLSYL